MYTRSFIASLAILLALGGAASAAQFGGATEQASVKPVRTVYSQQIACATPTGGTCSMSLPVVPAGQRLTVEFVTALMIMQVPNSLVDVELAPIGGTTRAFLPINASPGSYSTSYFYTVNQPSLAVFVAGETPVLSVYANTNNNYDVRASITGFLATAP